MPYREIIWDLDDDPDGNVVHLADHGISKEEAEDVLRNPILERTSRSSGRPEVVGRTTTGRLIVVVYEQIDEVTVLPVTAFDIEED